VISLIDLPFGTAITISLWVNSDATIENDGQWNAKVWAWCPTLDTPAI